MWRMGGSRLSNPAGRNATHAHRCTSGTRGDDCSGKAKRGEKADCQPRRIQLPPPTTETSGTRVGMVIVVQSLAVAKQTNKDIVSAGIFGLVISISPLVAHRIDGPGNVPHEDRPNEYTPDQ